MYVVDFRLLLLLPFLTPSTVVEHEEFRLVLEIKIRNQKWVKGHHISEDSAVPYKQCDYKKSPNVYKNCPKMILLEKWLILTPLQKFRKNVRDLGKLSVAKII